MKKFIHKINKYLIERYPLVWNTKVVWMLGISIIIHILFFILGLLALTNPESLHDRGAEDIFFENGTVFFSVMVSIVLIVIWLLNLFKNNAFKNFYPTKRFDLFKQFAIYFLIFLASTTFYFSYSLGLKTFISSKYDNETVNKEVKLSNKAAVFLSHDIKNYTIDKLVYPEPFGSLHCERGSKYIEYDKTYYQFLDIDYQFFNLRSEEVEGDDYREHQKFDYVYKQDKDSVTIYYFRDKVIDVTDALITTEPSYFNYSKVFYTNYNNGYDYDNFNNTYGYEYDIYNNWNEKKEELKRFISKENNALLSHADANEIQTLLSDFLKLNDKYKVKHNLTSEQWLKLVYYPEDFKLKHIIQDTEDKRSYNYSYENNNLKEIDKLHREIETDYFIESDNLETVFDNIDSIKRETLFDGRVHIFFWIAFSLATLLFIFRISGLRPLLFSIVSAVVLTILVSLVTALIAYGGSDNDVQYFISYFTLVIGLFILYMAIFNTTKIKKSISAIFINLSLAGFVPFVLLIIGIISMHQDDRCRVLYTDYRERREYCVTLFESLGFYWSHILLVIGFIFIFFFAKTIMKWRATPEG